MQRLNPLFLFYGLWKSLSQFGAGRPRAALLPRVLVIAVPVLVAILVMTFSGRVNAPDAALAGLSLLAGALLAAFAQLATWRLRLLERQEDHRITEQSDRDHLDETAAQLLVAAYLSAVAAVLLVIGMNLDTDPKTGAVLGLWAALVAAVASDVVVLFLMAVPRLYSAYVSINAVRDELNGHHIDR